MSRITIHELMNVQVITYRMKNVEVLIMLFCAICIIYYGFYVALVTISYIEITPVIGNAIVTKKKNA